MASPCPHRRCARSGVGTGFGAISAIARFQFFKSFVCGYPRRDEHSADQRGVAAGAGPRVGRGAHVGALQGERRARPPRPQGRRARDPRTAVGGARATATLARGGPAALRDGAAHGGRPARRVGALRALVGGCVPDERRRRAHARPPRALHAFAHGGGRACRHARRRRAWSVPRRRALPQAVVRAARASVHRDSRPARSAELPHGGCRAGWHMRTAATSRTRSSASCAPTRSASTTRSCGRRGPPCSRRVARECNFRRLPPAARNLCAPPLRTHRPAGIRDSLTTGPRCSRLNSARAFRPPPRSGRGRRGASCNALTKRLKPGSRGARSRSTTCARGTACSSSA